MKTQAGITALTAPMQPAIKDNDSYDRQKDSLAYRGGKEFMQPAGPYGSHPSYNKNTEFDWVY